MLIELHKVSLLVVDVQERLVGAMSDAEGLLARSRWMLEVAQALALPTVFSEQYPQGLGSTVPALTALVPGAEVVDKRHFSCVAADCLPETLLAREQVLVMGIEAHVCVLQTVLGLLSLDKQVFVIEDLVDSRRPQDCQLALQRMRDAGAFVVSREMVLFECLADSRHPQFRALSKSHLLGEQP